jgi:hypothetical protein
VNEQSLGKKVAEQKQNEELGFRYIKFEMLIRQPGKQLNRVVLYQRSTINLTDRSSSSCFKSFEEASFNLHTLAHVYHFFLLLPTISKEIDFTLHEMLQYFQFK